jgi:hypothetical protein
VCAARPLLSCKNCSIVYNKITIENEEHIKKNLIMGCKLIYKELLSFLIAKTDAGVKRHSVSYSGKFSYILPLPQHLEEEFCCCSQIAAPMDFRKLGRFSHCCSEDEG